MLSFGKCYVFYNTKYIYLFLFLVPSTEFLKPWEFLIGMSLKKKTKTLFVCTYWLPLVLVAALRSSLIAAGRRRGCYSLLQCENFSLWWLLLLWSMNCRAWASVIVELQLLVSQHMGSSQVWTASPALAGRLPITGPPGESSNVFCYSLQAPFIRTWIYANEVVLQFSDSFRMGAGH